MEKIRLFLKPSSILSNLIWFSFNLYLSEVFWCPTPQSVWVIHESPHSWGDTSESVPWAVEVGPKLPGWTLGTVASLECWPVDLAPPLKTFARNCYILPLKSFPRKWKVHFQNTSHNQSTRSTQDQKPNVNSCLSFKFMRPICKDCQYVTGLLAIYSISFHY